MDNGHANGHQPRSMRVLDLSVASRNDLSSVRLYDTQVLNSTLKLSTR